MKIRTCFVSNSSTSSFCILGLETTDELLDKVVEIAKQSLIDNNEFGEYDEYLCSSDALDIVGLTIYSDEYMSEYGSVIGIDINNDSADEVKQAEEKLKSIFGDLKFRVLCDTTAG